MNRDLSSQEFPRADSQSKSLAKSRPKSRSASRDLVSPLSVDRAISELRRGRMVVVQGGRGEAILITAAEAITSDILELLSTYANSEPAMAITARRAAVLGLANPHEKIAILSLNQGRQKLTAQFITEIADPLTELPAAINSKDISVTIKDSPPYDSQSAGVMLSKLARLLPAVVTATIKESANEHFDVIAWAGRHDLMSVDAGDIFQYENTIARTLSIVSEAQVPLTDADNTRVIAFRPLDGGIEHLAIVIGDPDPDKPVLTRLHSECFTGDLLGSLRCDCGDQLKGAIAEISAAGSGVLLYLAQEGRGIGLVNKLRAYELQDRGFDTIDANEQLGYDADERIYLPAVNMLEQLGYKKIRLLTNNPEKQRALIHCGVEVTERVPHHFPSNKHNETYLKTKASRSGHLF